jgi:hypothetical protein
VAGAPSAIAAGVLCATGSACGANQPSCGNEFAIVSRAASPYDCQAYTDAKSYQETDEREKGSLDP